MKTRWNIAFATLFVILLGSCAGDETLHGVQITMLAKSDQGLINGRSSAIIAFDEFMVGVTELEFETEFEDEQEENELEDSEEVEFEGPFLVDLLNQTSTPEFGIGDIAPGTYDEIEIELGPVLSEGNTVFIKFTLDDVTYELSTTKDLEIEIEDAAGYEINESAILNILVIVDLDELVANIDWSQAVADDDGIVRINDASNTFILEQVLSQFNEACEAGEDNDHDHQFDDDEGHD